ncbi:MAG TPA: integrin alpha, partial [Planctomycetota bacterium]|nr:integrin alpha [Planctomycetota bacterium]
LGDVNGDGHADFLVGSPNADHTHFVIFTTVTEEQAGSVKCISGATGLPLYTVWGDAEGDQLGYSVASLKGDVNGDGIPDFVVGAPQLEASTPQTGYARICSGANGATLFTLHGSGLDASFGYAVDAAGLVNGDAIPDAVVGVPGWTSNRGRIAIMSGASGTEIAMGAAADGAAAGERFGAAVAGIGNAVGDSKPEILIGAPSNDSVGANAGRVYCLNTSGAGSIAFTLSGTNPNDAFGTSVCGLGDYTGDGVTDLICVGAPGFDYVGVPNAGEVKAIFVTTLTDYWAQFGAAQDDGLGYTLRNIGDYTLDGFDDVIAGASEFSFSTPGPGYAYVISGYYGIVNYAFHGTSTFDLFGTAVSAAGDVNGDGVPDIVIGAQGSDPNGEFSGSAKVISLHPQGVTYYGASTPGCDGPQLLRANSAPKIGNSWFILAMDNVPPSGTGLMLITDSQGTGVDLFGLGIGLWVDLVFANSVIPADVYGTLDGHGFTILQIPLVPAFIGAPLYAQAIWAWSSCALPPFNLSASNGAQFVLQSN